MIMLEIIIAVIALALLVGVVVLTRLTRRIGRAADDVGLAARRITELTPAARALLESSRGAMESVRLVTSTTAHVVEDVRAVSGQASAVTTHILQGFDSEVIGRYRAVLAGARAGVDLLRHYRSGNGSHGAQSAEEVEEFSHVTR